MTDATLIPILLMAGDRTPAQVRHAFDAVDTPDGVLALRNGLAAQGHSDMGCAARRAAELRGRG